MDRIGSVDCSRVLPPRMILNDLLSFLPITDDDDVSICCFCCKCSCEMAVIALVLLANVGAALQYCWGCKQNSSNDVMRIPMVFCGCLFIILVV